MGVRNATVWSDGGRHFRSNQGIASMSMYLMKSMCLGADMPRHCPTSKIVFGIPSHFKNVCDGMQGHLRYCLDEAAKLRVVSSVQDLIRECKNVWESHSVDSSDCLPAHFHDYFPACSKAEFVASHLWQFSPSSFREGIAVSQCWSTTLNDVRRKTNPCFQDKAHILKAVNFKANLLPASTKIPAERMCFPIVVPVVTEEEEIEVAATEADAEAERELRQAIADHGSEAVPMNTRVQSGWSVSYRANEPEKKQFKAWRQRFTRGRLRYAGQALQPARVRRPQMEQLARQEEWAATRKKRTKRKRDA